VAVIGGGIAGIAAAVSLLDRGLEVVVVEPGPLGGKARTVQAAQGWQVEAGPHTFLGRHLALGWLVDRLGLRRVPLQPASRARFLGRSTRDGGSRLVRASPALLLHPPFLLGLFRSPPLREIAPVQDLLVDRFGPGISPIADALCRGVWASPAREVDAESAFPRLWAALAGGRSLAGAGAQLWLASRREGTRGSFTLLEGMGGIGRAAVLALGPARRLQCTARAIHREGAGWVVETGGSRMPARAVVLALPAPAAAELVLPHAPACAAALRRARYAPLSVVHSLTADSAWPSGFGVLRADAPTRALGTLFASDLVPGRVPPGRRGTACMVGGSEDPLALDLDDAAAGALASSEEAGLAGRASRLERVYVERHAAAVAVPTAGLHGAIAAAPLPAGLHLAGSYLGAGAMDDAARSGIDAAARVAA
jgi:oxygen-dependent protoporphyrinogen oxidase